MAERLVLENSVQLSNIREGKLFRFSTHQRYGAVVVDIYDYPDSFPHHATLRSENHGVVWSMVGFYYRISHILTRCVNYHS